MKKENEKKAALSRRKFLPFLGGAILLPLIGSSKEIEAMAEEDDTYQTLLTKDGKTVRVKSSALKDSKVIDKQISNDSLLNWLTPKDKKP
jgi:hypothetical protein